MVFQGKAKSLLDSRLLQPPGIVVAIDEVDGEHLQGFLTAMKQEVTRSHKGWALDNVITQNLITKFSRDDVDKPPPEGVYIYVIIFNRNMEAHISTNLDQGLFLEGASLDRKIGKLVESRAKARQISK